MAYEKSLKNFAWGFGVYAARYSGPSVADPAGLYTNRWTVAVHFGPWTWRRIF